MREAIVLLSGGKDSSYALCVSYMQGFSVECLVSVIPSDDRLFHVPNRSVLEQISEITEIPLVLTEGNGKESLANAVNSLTDSYEWMIVGGIRSEYQRFVFNEVASEFDMKVHTPFWGVSGEKYLRMMVGDGLRFRIVKSGVYGLENLVGVEIGRENVNLLIDLSRKLGFDPSGEGGEYETEVTPESLRHFFL